MRRSQNTVFILLLLVISLVIISAMCQKIDIETKSQPGAEENSNSIKKDVNDDDNDDVTVTDLKQRERVDVKQEELKKESEKQKDSLPTENEGGRRRTRSRQTSSFLDDWFESPHRHMRSVLRNFFRDVTDHHHDGSDGSDMLSSFFSDGDEDYFGDISTPFWPSIFNHRIGRNPFGRMRLSRQRNNIPSLFHKEEEEGFDDDDDINTRGVLMPSIFGIHPQSRLRSKDSISRDFDNFVERLSKTLANFEREEKDQWTEKEDRFILNVKVPEGTKKEDLKIEIEKQGEDISSEYLMTVKGKHEKHEKHESKDQNIQSLGTGTQKENQVEGQEPKSQLTHKSQEDQHLINRPQQFQSFDEVSEFEKRYILPGSVAHDKVNAHLEQDRLVIEMPKKPESIKKKEIFNVNVM